MSYLGKTQFKSSDVQRFDVTSSTSATHALSWTAPNEQSLIITINGVKQQDDAYSIAGSPTTVTLTDALITTDKLEIVGIVGVGTMNVPGVGSITADKLSATGTASSSTYLRGDMVWSAVEGGQITSQNTFFKNPNTVTNSQTTTIASTENAALIGPIGINSGVVWTIVGTLQIL
jgi:hypothetical protein